MLISTNSFINQASTRSVQCAPFAQTLPFSPVDRGSEASRARSHRLYSFCPLTAAAKRPAPVCTDFTEACPAKDEDGVGSGGEEENFGA